MENLDLRSKYIEAIGPEGLATVLNDLFSKGEHDPQFKAQRHFIEYRFGNQQSLIKIDLGQEPHVWFQDILGRTATRSIKETIARFLWEKGGDKERFSGNNFEQYLENAFKNERFDDLSRKRAIEDQSHWVHVTSELEEVIKPQTFVGALSFSEADQLLTVAERSTKSVNIPPVPAVEMQKSQSWMAFFKPASHTTITPTAEPELKNKSAKDSVTPKH